MLIIDGNFHDKLSKKTYIALGSFDGLHLGHMKLIKGCIEIAKANEAYSMVYTFRNHPRTVVNPDFVPKLLMSNDTKLDILNRAGIDITCLAEFNTELMKLSPEEFVLKLLNNFSMSGVIIGFNYKFGYKNTGNVDLLKELSIKYGFSVTVITPHNDSNGLISSSRIRSLLEQGEIEDANKLLYEPFKLSGKVIDGKKLGRKIGYPTANILVEKCYAIPKVGVYYTMVRHNNTLYKGMTNIGFNPTVSSDNTIKIETFILDFNGNIYNDNIELFFINRIRDEVKFDSIEELILQMNKDCGYVQGKNKVDL
ncbi:bifunctional riboflavin kinase/FAD synthetase [Clostridium sp. 19966]|uniref:bifunctional riboflavin kinase/FAD synthetase n=1 Tax=Clostridium sp. 19966 TaxID=2768166 RepID=UPI0028DE7B5B|nr:bifunctional riboflavin kinase/FAD synthetase [Clostridium sp. 19966]MDT8716415.1 bifunctional riboflavin kinase/FAD synthetase [Clostridium sp. 19966]